MSSFNDREKAFENKFAQESVVKFKIASRRRKLLGLWAGEKLGLGEEESLNYAKEIVSFGLEDTTSGAVIKKIATDAKTAGINISEAEIRTKNSEFEIIATKQITE